MRSLILHFTTLNDPNTLSQLQNLHPAPENPIKPLDPTVLRPAPKVEEQDVLKAVMRMNSNSAPGPDRMSPRLLHLLVTSQVSHEAGVKGLSVLTRLFARLARGDISEPSLPLLAAATFLPLQPLPNKIRPIAIGQAPRRLVKKVLLPAAISDSRNYLMPEQLAKGIPSTMGSIVHDAQMLAKRRGSDSPHTMALIDATNAFNSCSRQAILVALPLRAASPARIINEMYARTKAELVIPSSNPVKIQSLEGTQQGDPASMLLFFLSIQHLIRSISQSCNLSLNRWYADDGLLIGAVREVTRAL